jgi:hypothetical protein
MGFLRIAFSIAGRVVKRIGRYMCTPGREYH